MIAGSLSSVSLVSITPEGFSHHHPARDLGVSQGRFATTGVGGRAPGGRPPDRPELARIGPHRLTSKSRFGARHVSPREHAQAGFDAPVERRQDLCQSRGATQPGRGEPSLRTPRPDIARH